MPGVEEALGARTELAGDLLAGVETISLNQEIDFVKYRRVVLPIDGYRFWVRANLIAGGPASGVPNLGASGTSTPNAAPGEGAAVKRTVKGSLHYLTENRQEADSSYAVNRIVFTSSEEVVEFNEIGQDELWLGTFEGLRFGFSSTKSFYRQAELWHYMGDAVYSVMDPMIIDDVAQFSGRQIVSNSIPLWLAINAFDPAASPWVPYPKPPTLYPAFLSEDNLVPPFATVDVPPDTTAIASAPTLGLRLSRSQLVRERVRVTLWGLDNDAASDFADFVNQWTLDERTFGLMNSPVIRDERMTQVELEVIAKKKTMVFEINYHQQSARDVARQLILSAVPTFRFQN